MSLVPRSLQEMVDLVVSVNKFVFHEVLLAVGSRYMTCHVV